MNFNQQIPNTIKMIKYGDCVRFEWIIEEKIVKSGTFN